MQYSQPSSHVLSRSFPARLQDTADHKCSYVCCHLRQFGCVADERRRRTRGGASNIGGHTEAIGEFCARYGCELCWFRGTCHTLERSAAFSIVWYCKGRRPQSVHGQMVVGCRHRNVRGHRVSRWVDGEVEGEAVEATFWKGTGKKIKSRQCWTATNVRLMWTDQDKFLV